MQLLVPLTMHITVCMTDYGQLTHFAAVQTCTPCRVLVGPTQVQYSRAQNCSYHARLSGREAYLSLATCVDVFKCIDRGHARVLTLSGRILYSDRSGIVLAPVMSMNFASISSSSSLFQVAVSVHR